MAVRVLELGSIAISKTIKCSVINVLSLNRKSCMGTSLVTLVSLKYFWFWGLAVFTHFIYDNNADN